MDDDTFGMEFETMNSFRVSDFERFTDSYDDGCEEVSTLASQQQAHTVTSIEKHLLPFAFPSLGGSTLCSAAVTPSPLPKRSAFAFAIPKSIVQRSIVRRYSPPDKPSHLLPCNFETFKSAEEVVETIKIRLDNMRHLVTHKQLQPKPLTT